MLLSLRPPVPTQSRTSWERDKLVIRINKSSEVLGLADETEFTACCLLHRYLDVCEEEPRPIIAIACMVIASKVEEDLRRLRDFINCLLMLNDNLEWADEPPELNDSYWETKAKIVEAEQIVLRYLGFDTSVSHPHRVARIMMDRLGKPNCEDIFQFLRQVTRHDDLLRCPVLLLSAAIVDICSKYLDEKWYLPLSISDEGFSNVREKITSHLQTNDQAKEYS